MIYPPQPWQRQPPGHSTASLRWRSQLRFLHNFGVGGVRGHEVVGRSGGLVLTWTGTAQAPTAKPEPRGGAALCFSGDGTNYLAGGGSASIPAAANEPIALFAYGRTTATQTQFIVARGPLAGNNPISNMSVGANGAATASGQFIPIVRDDAGSISFQSSGPTVNDGLFHLLVIQRNATKWQYSADAALLADLGTAGNAMGATTFQENNVSYATDTLNGAINGACDIAVGGLMIGRCFTQGEIDELWQNPWLLFAPMQRRVFINAAAAAASRLVKMAGEWGGYAGRSGGFAG